MNPWIKAARLRTLPLAASGILLGSAISFLNNQFNYITLFLGLITALLLQILSNYGNDYGDFKKGTDQKAGRKDRMLNTGKISEGSMLKALIILTLITFISGILLLANSKLTFSLEMWFFLMLGILAIGAAIKYTIGKNAFAYSGLGDVFVFIFFGMVSVCGISYLHSGVFYVEALAAGIGCGLLSTGVLNVNNIRDIKTDKESNKITIPVRFGYRFSIIYQRILVWFGVLAVFFSFIMHIQGDTIHLTPLEYAMIIIVFSPIFVLIAGHISTIEKIKNGEQLLYNAELKKLSLTTLLLVLIYWIITIVYIS